MGDTVRQGTANHRSVGRASFTSPSIVGAGRKIKSQSPVPEGAIPGWGFPHGRLKLSVSPDRDTGFTLLLGRRQSSADPYCWHIYSQSQATDRLHKDLEGMRLREQQPAYAQKRGI